MSYHDKLSRESDVISRTVNNDDDVITKFNLKLNRDDSEDCPITKLLLMMHVIHFLIKLHYINLSDGSCDDDKGARPKIIGFLKSAPTTTIVKEVKKC